MTPELFSWGLRIGRISGIVIRLHWFLLLFWFFELDDFLGLKHITRAQALGYWALFVLPFFLIILLHELGHCYTARRVGGHAEEILLWPLGGLAFVNAPYSWWPQFLVAAGGPLVNVIILIVAYPGFWYLSHTWPGLEQSLSYDTLRYVFCHSNVYLLLFNLLPLYPLDGGRIFHALLWGYQEHKEGYGMGPYYRATIITVYVSRVTAVVAAVFMLVYFESLWGAFIALWAWMGTEELRLRAQAGEGPEASTFGYDFSRGYTSLEGNQRPPKKPRGLIAGFKRRLAERRQISARDEQQLEELLRKISAQGMASLTRAERRFLGKMSRRKRHDRE